MYNNALGSLETDSTLEPMNTACGICLEEPIQNAVVLSQCRHAFCFSCLKEWQSYDKGGTDNKWCPFCRGSIEKSVAEEAWEKARMLVTRALRLQENDAKRRELCELAVAELDKLLEGEKNETHLLYYKGDVLRNVRPDEAIVLLNRVLELSKERDEITALQMEANEAFKAGDLFTTERIMEEVTSRYGEVHEWPTRFGEGPYRLFPVRIALAESLEAAGRWEEAEDEYRAMFEALAPDPRYMNDDLISDLHSIKMGLCRCLYQSNRFEGAINVGRDVINMGRAWPGAHKLVAQAQLGHARKLGCKMSFTRPNCSGMNTSLKTTIEDAILTMRRALVYEAPWDEANKQLNENYLMELVREAAQV
jgi:tetratricopeptide (TPR) repeat protein